MISKSNFTSVLNYRSSSSAASSSSTAQPTQAGDFTGSKKTNVGVIVGPIVAGLAVLAIVFFVALWWYKSRRTAPSKEKEDAVAPFPRNDRPAVWVKGQEAGVIPTTQVYEAVVPTNGGKRARIAEGTPAASTSTLLPPSQPVSSGVPAEPVLSRSGHSHQPSTVGAQSVNTPSSGPSMDVNQIIELIAQRIDPRTNVPQGDAPPRYPF